ncbi:MAG: NAD(P)H-hydrate dehydratase [Deltaproteobacteria bacterium]|nr:NAD(P)H-hydrate dehydratase [Deltaproteobacteria bacterium]
MNHAATNRLLGAPLPTPEEMASWDDASIKEFNIPASLLMENASREAFHVINAMLEPERRILLIMGGGNNGGDGAALGRHLLDAGHHVLVCHARPLDSTDSTLGGHITMARKNGVPFIPLALSDNRLITPPEYRRIAHSPHLLVDALLGTGFSGCLREAELAMIRFMNHMRESVPVVSLDIPSGLDGLTGIPRPEAVRANHTVTFEAAKAGLAFPHAREYTGSVHVRRIGIPTAVHTMRPASFYSLDPRPAAWPENKPDMHKGQGGRVVIFGGSRGLTGAPALAALGALRSGAGLVTVACPGGIEPQIRPAFPEIMTEPLGTGEKWNIGLVPACIKAVTELGHAAALVVGPGIGRSAETRDVIESIIKEKNRPPLILDADGLYPLGGGKGSPLLRALRGDDCITPHPGEAAHILETSAGDIQAARVASIRTLTRATRATVVLKGAGTLIARQGAPIFIAPFTSPSLAVGGSGDVLSGIVAALLAKVRVNYPATPEDALRAVCLGVFMHGKAGEYLDARFPFRGALARDIAEAVPHVARNSGKQDY